MIMTEEYRRVWQLEVRELAWQIAEEFPLEEEELDDDIEW